MLTVDDLLKMKNHNTYGWFKTIAIAAEYGDQELLGHLDRVSHYAAIVAKGIGLSPNDQERIKMASLLHDVGKSVIPKEILLQPRKLTTNERKLVEQHTQFGHELLETLIKVIDESKNIVDHGAFIMAREIALYHHENWDGTGYPQRLHKDHIPLHARIVRIVDAIDAMRQQRVYKQAWSWDQVLNEIKVQKGKLFDPALVTWVLQYNDILIGESPRKSASAE